MFKGNLTPPTLPPEVFKIMVNFSPLVWNGCLMIDRSPELSVLAVTQALCVRRLPRWCRCLTLSSKTGLFSSDGSSQVSLGCALTLRRVQISSPVGGTWWMCPVCFGSIYQKISTDLWVVWAALWAPLPHRCADISIQGRCSVSGGIQR